MDALYLIATIAGQPVAIESARVDSVVDLAAITPVPLAAAHIAGLAALRSKVITVIDPATALGVRPAGQKVVKGRAVVMAVDGHQFGVLVDSVEDVTTIAAEPHPVRAPLGEGWAKVALGAIEYHDETLLLIDPMRW